MIADPDVVHVSIAAAATDAATLLSAHPTLPSVSHCAIDWDHTRELPRVSALLYPSATELIDLATWAETLAITEITAVRHEQPHSFTVLALDTDHGGSLLRITTQPTDGQLAALWGAAEHMPAIGEPTTISVATLYAAAEHADAVTVEESATLLAATEAGAA